MKKKIFTLLSLLCCAVTASWADVTFHTPSEDGEIFWTTTANVVTTPQTWLVDNSTTEKAITPDIDPSTEEAGTISKGNYRLVKKLTDPKYLDVYVTGITALKVFAYNNGSSARELKAKVVKVNDDATETVISDGVIASYSSSKGGAMGTIDLTKSSKYKISLYGTNEIVVYALKFVSAGASVSISDVTVNGESISSVDLVTLTSTKALTIDEEQTVVPEVVFLLSNSTTKSATIAKDEDNYTASATVNGEDYVITFSNLNFVDYLTVTGEKEILLTKENIDLYPYLSSSDNFSERTINGVTAYWHNLSSVDRYINIKVEGAKSFEIYLQNSSAGRTYRVQVGENAISSIMHQAKVDDNTTDLRTSGLIACTSSTATLIQLKGGGNTVYPYKIVFYTDDVTATISSAKYASFSNACAVNIPEGVKAYYMSAAEGETTTLTEITDGIIPANTGVILSGNAGTYNFSGAATTTTYENKLVANLTTLGTYNYETSRGEGYYTLAAGPSFKESTGYTEHEPSTFLGAGKAFLPKANVDSSARELTINFGDATAINSIEAAQQTSGEYYNLAGQRVAQPTKGLYIVNGKKYVVK